MKKIFAVFVVVGVMVLSQSVSAVTIEDVVDSYCGAGAWTEHGYELFVVDPTKAYHVKSIAKYAAYNQDFGWYTPGTPGSEQMIIQDVVPGDTGTYGPTGVNPIGFYIYVHDTNENWYTEQSMNWDGVDHARVFTCNSNPKAMILAFEDLTGGGDLDYTDVVVVTEVETGAPEPLIAIAIITAFAPAVAYGLVRRRKK